jgi:hypothetical protein
MDADTWRGDDELAPSIQRALRARHRVSAGPSPKRARYRALNRPRCSNPHSSAISATVVDAGEESNRVLGAHACLVRGGRGHPDA